MSNALTVTLTAGVPTAPSGTVSTLDNLPNLGIPIVDGTTATIKSAVKAASTAAVATDPALVVAISPNNTVPVSLASVPSHAVTNAGTFAVQSTPVASAVLMGIVKVGDGTNTVAVKAASTAPLATDPALVVAISPNSVNSNGRALPAGSAPVVLNSQTYTDVAASQTAALFGATGASGDYLDGVLIVPETAAAGAVSVTDGSGSAITIFAGGGTTALPTLAPFFVPIGAVSKNGAGGWKGTTGTNVHIRAVGNFT